MRWRKLGLVYAADGKLPWAQSHAFAPTPVMMQNGVIRVYVTSCDGDMVGRVGHVDLDAADPTRILRVADAPVLDIGAPGCFDDNGVVCTSVVEVGDELWMYYAGFQLGKKVRYYLFSGRAVSADGGKTFIRQSAVPILDRSDGERFVRSGPFVLRDGPSRFRMWYISGDEFINVAGKDVPRYGIRYLESADGIGWSRSGVPVISPAGDDEYGFGRPFVTRTPSGYRIWYSLRSRSNWYRIGFADSEDGLTWTRHDDDAGIDVSASGWDSGIVCYAAVFQSNGQTFMLYNGNDYGRTGFGAAVLETD